MSKRDLRKLSPDKSAAAFLTQLSESREAFTVFNQEAKRKGLMSSRPSINPQNEYYEKYMKPTTFLGGSSAKKLSILGKLNQTSTNSIHVGKESVANSTFSKTRASFVPLRDLLARNHEDRVQDYLEKMKGLNMDEIVNSKAALKTER